jgi:FKBP-type peptidyl-prolyl cis-trans isomerase SlyD
MMDKEAGATFNVDVKAADAYGERREGLSQRVPKKHFGNTKLARASRSCCRPTSARVR